MSYETATVRTAQRKALRTHPDAQNVLRGRSASLLTKLELENGLRTLGLDPDAIGRQALAGIATVPATAPTCDNLPQDDEDTVDNAADGPGQTGPDAAVEAELQSLRQLVGLGGFAALDDRLRQLVIEARKPAVEIVRTVEVMVPTGGPGSAIIARPAPVAVPVAKRTGVSASWRSLFKVHGPLGHRETELWDGAHPSTPTVDDEYVWPNPETAIALALFANRMNVYLYGPAGTGKTEWARQLAARTGRPYVLIACDDGTDAATLLGMTVPDGAGGVKWQDGALTKAVRTPGCIICVDEPSVARPGALMVLQDVLQNRTLHISETGEVVKCAVGVLFCCTDNTNGTGGGSRQGYTATNRLNAAFLDRFAAMVDFDYLPKEREISVLVAKTGCTVELATLLVTTAQVTRAAVNNTQLSRGIGLRRLLAWARLLTDGIKAEDAFRVAILNCADLQDVETLREQCSLSYDKATVAAALNPGAPVVIDPSDTNPTPAGREAATDFASGPLPAGYPYNRTI